jgi:hypothetical protein
MCEQGEKVVAASDGSGFVRFGRGFAAWDRSAEVGEGKNGTTGIAALEGGEAGRRGGKPSDGWTVSFGQRLGRRGA